MSLRRSVSAVMSSLVALVLAAGCSGDRDEVPTERPDQAAVQVAGITLVPAGSKVRSQCKATARRLGYGVLCPGLLPEGAQPSRVVGPLAHSPFADDYVRPGFRGFSTWAFGSLDFPAAALEGHLVVATSPEVVDARHFAYLEPVAGEDVVIEGPARVHGRTARWVRVPQSSSSIFGGHTILLWSRDGHTYGVGFHGTGTRIRALDRAVAERASIVEP